MAKSRIAYITSPVTARTHGMRSSTRMIRFSLFGVRNSTPPLSGAVIRSRPAGEWRKTGMA